MPHFYATWISPQSSIIADVPPLNHSLMAFNSADPSLTGLASRLPLARRSRKTGAGRREAEQETHANGNRNRGRNQGHNQHRRQDWDQGLPRRSATADKYPGSARESRALWIREAHAGVGEFG